MGHINMPNFQFKKWNLISEKIIPPPPYLNILELPLYRTEMWTWKELFLIYAFPLLVYFSHRAIFCAFKTNIRFRTPHCKHSKYFFVLLQKITTLTLTLLAYCEIIIWAGLYLVPWVSWKRFPYLPVYLGIDI